MLKYIESLAIAALAVFAPIKAAIITTIVLVIIDLVAGLIAAHKRGELITSSGIKRTVGKIVLYESAICAGFLCQTYLTGDLFPASKIITALVGVVELKSIMENMDTISGSSLFKSILSRILQAQEEISKEPPK